MTTASSVHEASTDAFIWSVQSPVSSSRTRVYRTPLPDQLASLTTSQTTKEENPVRPAAKADLGPIGRLLVL